MTHYDLREENIENQLDNIFKAINSRERISKAAYTIVIQKPGGETIRPLGAPCLNYLTIQLHANPKRLNMLALYRNHDFLERAYGNYWGLCNLIRFMARETDFNPGSLTCVSSHAYIANKKRAFKTFVESLS
jgi:thymidylate synthase